jgi:hypothetical protein
MHHSLPRHLRPGLPRRARTGGLAANLGSGESRDLALRRVAIGASLVGMASMALVALFQSGAIRHLPDPPVDGFDADHVNAPERSSLWGVPDGFCKCAAHAIMLALAAAWTADRARRRPWLPFLAAGFALGQAIAAGRALWRMPKVDKAWCGYRLVDAMVHFAMAAIMLPAAMGALCQRMSRRGIVWIRTETGL